MMFSRKFFNLILYRNCLGERWSSHLICHKRQLLDVDTCRGKRRRAAGMVVPPHDAPSPSPLQTADNWPDGKDLGLVR